ncbi:MAG: hypothetical protein ABIP21_11790 [Acidimicrobiia bacterium]
MSKTVTDADLIHRRYTDLGGDDTSDADLVAQVAQRVQLPREGHADSFILHAPLEVLARAALLPWVAPAGRPLARLRLVAVATQFEAQPAMEAPAASASEQPPETAAAALVAALSTADLEATDQAAVNLAVSAPGATLTNLIGDAVLPGLAAAGHAPIFLYQLPRVSPRGEAPTALLRPLVRELGRFPQLQLEWVQNRPTSGGSAAALADALASVPQLGVPGSTFIYPLMHQVDQQVAPELLRPTLGGVNVQDARPIILRAAARAMVMGPAEHAPYGWSHCLTMSQAALEIAFRLKDPSLGIAVAASNVIGFLAALADTPIPSTIELDHSGGTFTAAVADGMTTAAARAFHAADDELVGIRTEIVTAACSRHDAHLVKYTLACVDAMAVDPPAARLYLAAAATLLAYWSAIVDPDDPLAT